jgi:hypothetical protein
VLGGLRDATLARALGRLEAVRHDFTRVESFVAFAGFPRSGHTLIGSLLTAHPDAVVAHELDALRYVQHWTDRDALYGLIARQDRKFAAAGSVWTGYNYSVPGQWQGRYRTLRVIGDKKGGTTARRLADQPELLDRLRATVPVPIRFVIVTRDPNDNIARMATRDGTSLDQAIDGYFHRAAAVARLTRLADCFCLTHEDFTAEPAASLTELAGWLGLDADPGWATACAALVRPASSARDDVTWDLDALRRVRRMTAENDLLAGYT